MDPASIIASFAWGTCMIARTRGSLTSTIQTTMCIGKTSGEGLRLPETMGAIITWLHAHDDIYIADRVLLLCIPYCDLKKAGFINGLDGAMNWHAAT